MTEDSNDKTVLAQRRKDAEKSRSRMESLRVKRQHHILCIAKPGSGGTRSVASAGAEKTKSIISQSAQRTQRTATPNYWALRADFKPETLNAAKSPTRRRRKPATSYWQPATVLTGIYRMNRMFTEKAKNCITFYPAYPVHPC